METREIPRTSLDKAHALLEELAELPSEELAQVPLIGESLAGLGNMAGAMAQQLSGLLEGKAASELDAELLGAATSLLRLRGDDALPRAVVATSAPMPGGVNR